MNITVLVYLILAVSSVAHAADIGQARKPSEAAVSAKKGNIVYSAVPFDATVEKLPANYQGHSVLEIHRKLSPPHEKGEFEKSEEYEARRTRWEETSFLGKITLTDLLAFKISQFLAPDSLSIKYDADREEMTATISFKKRQFDSFGMRPSIETRWLETFYKLKTSDSYIGVTKMGVKSRVMKYRDTSEGLGIKDLPVPVSEISISKPLSRDDAQRVKRGIVAYAITSLKEPYKIDDFTLSTASLDKPFIFHTDYHGLWVGLKAIWLVNGTTGDIIAKVEAPFYQCPIIGSCRFDSHFTCQPNEGLIDKPKTCHLDSF